MLFGKVNAAPFFSLLSLLLFEKDFHWNTKLGPKYFSEWKCNAALIAQVFLLAEAVNVPPPIFWKKWNSSTTFRRKLFLRSSSSSTSLRVKARSATGTEFSKQFKTISSFDVHELREREGVRERVLVSEREREGECARLGKSVPQLRMRKRVRECWGFS